MIDVIEARLVDDRAIVLQRLDELGLTLTGLERVVDAALVESRNATDLHPANAAGTFAYHHGVAGLRREFLGETWAIDRSDGIESIFNEQLQIKVAFCNVDLACGKDHPKPRSDKGAGAERASGPSLFDHAGVVEVATAEKPTVGTALFYLMVDQEGRAELTRPVISKGTFTGWVERIFVIPVANSEIEVRPLETDEPADFEPQIVRK